MLAKSSLNRIQAENEKPKPPYYASDESKQKGLFQHLAQPTLNSVLSRHRRVTTRAGATGTAGTAMAVPVFEEEKWRCWDSDLRARS